MSLHEEYTRRRSPYKPLVLYEKRSAVLLKSTAKPYNWRILSINWIDHGYHPGHFEVSYSHIIHNGFEDGMLMRDISSEGWYWDEYERNLLNYVGNIKKSGYDATFVEEHLLSCWEIYLILIDSWLSENMSLDFFDVVEQSLNTENSIDSRTELVNDALNSIEEKSEVVSDIWKFSVAPLARHQHTNWLADLVNES